jgi:TetR/AcrR family transcriptional regulator, transcriptional repressor for nem operon
VSTTKEKIMDAAEDAIRSGGFAAFSFRTIADRLSIKSSSVHYHFQSKGVLGEAVAKRYRERFIESLGDAATSDALERFANTFKSALKGSETVCLCGVLAGESGKLPEGVRTELQAFSSDCRTWLEKAFSFRGFDDPETLALVFFSSLEGGMTFAVLNRKHQELGKVADYLLESFKAPAS